MATIRVNPRNVNTEAKKARSGDTLLFTEGDYRDVRVDLVRERIRITAEDDVTLHNRSIIDISAPNCVVEKLEFENGGRVNAQIRSLNNVSRQARNAIIRNLTFRNYEGHAKRITAGSQMMHNWIDLNVLIEDITLENIEGKSNTGRPGGELISVKAGATKLINCVAINCQGRFSFRQGMGNVAYQCKTQNTPASFRGRAGMQVYGFHHSVIDYTMDDNANLRIGDGDVNSREELRKGQNHWPASDLTVTGAEGGQIVFQRRYRKYRPERVHLYDNDSRLVDEWD